MCDYNDGKIYTIRCLTDKTLIYVGSTTQELSKRFGDHKSICKSEKWKNYKLYKEVNGDWRNWYIELNQLYPCSCKEELKAKEGEIIRKIGTLNVRIEGRTKQEWNEDNKEHRLEKQRNYNKINKEIISEKREAKITCECGCISTNRHISRHKKSKKHSELMKVQALPQQQVQDEQ